jgi:uncharacterized protein YceK
MKNLYFLIIFISLSVLLGGCATYKTTSHFTIDSPKLYSGTRMDLDAMNQSQSYIVKKYNVDAPSHPLLDLPCSFILDTVIFIPVALPVAIGGSILN